MLILIIFLAALVAVAVALLLRERQNNQDLTDELNRVREGSRRVDHFLSGMFGEMRTEGGMKGAMNLAAGYLADSAHHLRRCTSLRSHRLLLRSRSRGSRY